MSGVLSFDAGATFILRSYKSLGDQFQYRWSNSYEVVAMASGVLADLKTLLDRITMFEISLHAEAVSIDSGSISTWTADSAPYNPENLIVYPWDGFTGARIVTAMVGLEVTALAKRGPTSGRNGKLYLRGMLGEADVEREGTGFKFTNPSVIGDEFSDAVSDSSLGYHLFGGMASLKLAMIGQYVGGTGVDIRPLSSLVLNGVATLDLKHQWYNQPNRSLNAQVRRASIAAGKYKAPAPRPVRILV